MEDISEDVIHSINIYIKRLPIIENRVMDLFGNSQNIKKLINEIIKINNSTLTSFISDEKLSELDFSEYNLRFADLNSALEEELNIYRLTKGK